MNIFKIRYVIVPSTLSLILACGCQENEKKPPARADASDDAIIAQDKASQVILAIATVGPSKAAATQPSGTNVTGTVTFAQTAGKVRVTADIVGLPANSTHGFHIHEKGDLSAADFSSAGDHFNPDHHVHGGPTTGPVHAGDLGNLKSNAEGRAHLELTLTTISVGGAKNDVLGRSVIIHAKADDLASQPSGNSGARIAGGVIEKAD